MFSVVIPVYNSSAVVEETVRQVRDFFISSNLAFEVILVNDGSSDNSWAKIAALANKHDDVVAIDLLRNYGQHCANLCGFRAARGDYVVTIDDDLQNPPQEIAKLIAESEQGYDLVIGRFEAKRHSLVRRLGSQIVGKLNRKIFHIRDNLVLSDFRLIRRDVIERVCRDNSYAPYVPGLLLKYSARRANVLVDHRPRGSGKSTYTLSKLLGLVATLLFNHSTLPLRYTTAFGFIVSALSFVLGLFYLARGLLLGTHTSGWLTLVVLLSFFNAVLMLILSVIGEYIVRVLRDMGSHSAYEIREVVGK
jgi:glycosyltransferase involved in cell wall biosynthesis